MRSPFAQNLPLADTVPESRAHPRVVDLGKIEVDVFVDETERAGRRRSIVSVVTIVLGGDSSGVRLFADSCEVAPVETAVYAVEHARSSVDGPRPFLELRCPATSFAIDLPETPHVALPEAGDEVDGSEVIEIRFRKRRVVPELVLYGGFYRCSNVRRDRAILLPVGPPPRVPHRVTASLRWREIRTAKSPFRSLRIHHVARVDRSFVVAAQNAR
jgi:hypothetical protein